jgi:zinc transport system substrate-binding protein
LRSLLVLILVALALASTACDGASVQSGRIGVVVSVEPHAFLVNRIAGDRVDLHVLVGPGESPATYQPTDLEVSRVMRARLFFRTGVPFENGKWLAAARSSGGNIRIVDLRDGIELRAMEAGHHHGEDDDHAADEAVEDDPHIWLSPRLLAIQAKTVADALAAVDPDRAGIYRANLAGLQVELAGLTEELTVLLDRVRGRRIFVFHPAYGYFTDEFGLMQVAMEAEGKEPSDHELSGLLAKARADGVRAIFVQEQIVGRSAEVLADAIGAKLIRLDPLARDVPANLRDMAEKILSAFP